MLAGDLLPGRGAAVSRDDFVLVWIGVGIGTVLGMIAMIVFYTVVMAGLA